jgi:hypothetical protein
MLRETQQPCRAWMQAPTCRSAQLTQAFASPALPCGIFHMQVVVERAFTSCVRVLAADADSDVVWGGDNAGRLAVFR